MKVLLSVVGIMLLTGCAGQPVSIVENMRFIRDGNTEAFRPSLSVTVVQECVKERGYHETTRINDKVYHCDGQYKLVGTPYGTQAGSMTGLGGAMIQGGAIVGGAYLLADGIRDSGSTTTNNNETSSNGGNSNSLSSARSDSYSQSGASAAASGGAGGNGYGYGGKGGNSSSMSSSGMPMRGGD